MVTSNGNATTVVTNANLTGVVTSIGNTTSVAYQTGTGSTFVMNTSPSLVTPLLGDANATSVTSPLYVSTPQALASGATISWNPANGLNAAVTLDQNSTLSFSATPAAGTYGTLVITQDATGGRTITLPSTANKILGSASTTTIALSAEPSAKDILNFYYDGTNCYWNIGQGYGIAATLAPTSLTSSVTGTLPVANGGTGSATQNFVDLTTAQTITGDKTFSSDLNINGTKFGTNGIPGNVAIGNNSGMNNQGLETVAIGGGTGYNNQGTTAVAVGFLAGYTFQGVGAIALGESAGYMFQGSNAIAIGKNAGNNLQHDNSIVLNASGNELRGDTNAGLFIDPIRSNLGTSSLFYDATTKEITYGSSPSVSLTSSVTGVLPLTNGGTGSSSQNFVDLTTDQTVAGNKTFTGRIFGKTAFLNGGDGTFGNAFLVSNNDSGFLASYNSLGTIRTGYLGFSSGNSVILMAEETNSLILGAGNQNTLTLGANQNATFTGGAVINGQTDINGSLTANNGTFSQRITGKTAFLNGGDGTFGNAFLVSNNDSGFLASYNSLGTIRTGYLGFSSGNSVILMAEETNSLILGAGNQNTLTLGANQNATFTGNVTATSFIKAGGSVTEFLKADGSVDSNTYLTTSGTATNVSGVVALANGGTGATNPIDALNNLGASPLASPNFTGTPTAPTAATTTNNTQIATTEFVNAAIAAGANGNSVPYIGATRAVDLGNYDLKVHGLTIGTGPSNNGENTVIGNNTLTNPNTYYSTAVGANTLSNTSGLYNSAFGNKAGIEVTSGTNNTLLGYYSGRGITDGSKNTFIGSNINLGNVSNNIALSDGDGTIRLRHDGTKWNASGDMIINSVEVGTGPSNNGANSVLGNNALQNTGANNSVAIGYETLRNASSSSNVGVGFQALTSTTTGANNNAVGFQSFISNTTGYDNTGLGYASGYHNTTGFRNTYLGFLAGHGITTGKYNTIIGYTPNLPADLSNAIILADGEGNRRAFYDNSISTWNFQGNLSINGVTVGGGNNNTIVGNGNLISNTNGYENTTTGNNAMYSNTTGYRNTSTGFQSLYNNLTGANNVSDGWHSLFNNTNGNNNSASGYDSLSNNTTGSQNTAFGMYALNGNTTGNNNTAIGFGANVNSNSYNNAMAIGSNAVATASNMIQLGDGAVTRLNTSGNLTLAGGVLVGAGASFNGENTVVGANALTNAGTYYSTAVGANTLSNTSGLYNSAFGNKAGIEVTSGTNNTLLGYYSGRGITDGSKNTFIGSNINLGNVSNNIALSDGDGNIRLRYDGTEWNMFSNYLKLNNGIVMGADRNGNNTNTVVGYNALNYNNSLNTGSENTALGFNSLGNNTSGTLNTASGLNALANNTTGNFNTANGSGTLQANSTGNLNIAMGLYALGNNTTGSNNVAIGYAAMDNHYSGDRNTAIGNNTKISNTVENSIAIGNDASVSSSNIIQLGNGNITDVYTSGTIHANALQITSDRRLKTNIEPIQNSIETIMKLNPVHYDKKNSLESKEYVNKENGFIAQEIQKVVPFIVKESSDKEKLLSVDYTSIIPVLTKGIQEQQKQIEEQQEQIDKLKALVEQMLNKKN